MSLLAGLLRSAFPVGSLRRDRVLGVARRAGVLPPAPESAYQRWQRSIEASSNVDVADADVLQRANETVGFVIEIDVTGRTDAGALTRTLVSLTNQSFQNWVAPLPALASAGQGSQRLIVDARGADHRFSPSNLEALPANIYSVHIRFGDALAHHALADLAVLVVGHPSAGLVSGEFDMIDPISGLRSAPAAIGPWEPDLADQFEFSEGFVALRRTATRNDGQSAGQSAGREDFVAAPHSPRVLLHRLVEPSDRNASLLPPSKSTRPGLRSERSQHRHAGLRVHHPVQAGTTAVVVVRDAPALSDSLRPSARHSILRYMAKDPSDSILRLSASQVSVIDVISWNSKEPFPPISDSAQVVAVVDGALVPSESTWLEDLVGALQQPHVFAVAPLLLVPSGIAFDGGVIVRSDAEPIMRARSGRLDLAPFELARCRQVVSLSGRAVVMRRDDFMEDHALPTALERGTFSSALHDAAKRSRRVNLIWAHQRWTLSLANQALPTDSPMLAWQRGRLRTWWESNVVAHEPEPGRIGEGVW